MYHRATPLPADVAPPRMLPLSRRNPAARPAILSEFPCLMFHRAGLPSLHGDGHRLQWVLLLIVILSALAPNLMT